MHSDGAATGCRDVYVAGFYTTSGTAMNPHFWVEFIGRWLAAA